MQIDCPNCKAPIQLPPKLMQVGVDRLSCEQCNFTFVARLGRPSTAEKHERDASLPIFLEGVKSSAAGQQTAGEIGTSRPAFIPADTKTTVVVDPDLKTEIEDYRSTNTAPKAETNSGWVTASTERTEVEQRQPGLRNLQTEPMSDDSPEDVTERHEIAFDAHATNALHGVSTERTGSSSPAALLAHNIPAQPVAVLRNPRLSPVSNAESTVLNDFGASFVAQPPSHSSRAARAVGLLVSVVVLSTTLLALFVLYRNDWSFEISEFDQMVARAFSKQQPRALPPELAQLEVSKPIAELTYLKDGQPVVTAEGVVKNVGTQTRRFIYLRASIMRSQHVIATEEAPAGNLFNRSELSQLTKRRLQATLNPAGRQGRNARVEPGESVAYMVVITGLPPGFDLSQHKVVAEVSQAEMERPNE